MGQYVFRAVGTTVAGTGTLAPGMPAGWQPDDLLALYTTCVSTSETLDAADVGDGWVEAAVADAGGHENLKLFLKIAEEGDTAPSCDWSGTSGGCAQIAAFSGDVFTNLATIVAHVISRESVTTRPKIWGLTVTTPNCLIISMSRIVKTAVSNGTTYNSPTASIIELGEYEANGTNIAAVWGYQIQSAAANVAEASWSPQGTAESANCNFLALTVALKSSSATVTAQGAGGTSTAAASAGQAQGSSGVSAQGSGAIAAAVAAAATISTDTQQIVVASGSPASTAVSLKTLFDPPAEDGDVYIVDKVTTPGGYAVTVNADGTFRFDGQGDESRQVIGVDLIQASNERNRGRGYVAINDLPPQLVGSAGGFISAPFAPFVPVDLRLHEQVRDPQGGTLTFELRAGPLPPGLRLTRGGRLHGVPTNIGTYPVTWGVRGAYGAPAIIEDIIDVAYGATGAGDTVEATAAAATATVSVTASGAGVSDTATASTGSAEGGSAEFDYYIGPGGSDSNDGSFASPWAITALATKSAIAGARVGLLDGTYVLSDTSGKDPGNNDGIQYILHGGTDASHHTVIEAVNPRQAIITTNNGGSYPQGSGAGQGSWPALQIRAGVNHVTLRVLRLYQFSFTALSVRGSDVLVEDCDIGDVVHSRDAFYDPPDNCSAINTGGGGSGLTIRNCRIHDVYRTGTSADTNQGCIGPLYDYSDVLVENCTLYNSGHAIGPKHAFGKLTVRYNLIHSMQGYAIRSMTEEDSSATPGGGSIHHNIIFDIGNLSGSDDPQADMLPRDTDFYNNTVVFTSAIGGAGAGLAHYNGPSNTAGVTSANRYWNNIFFLPAAVSVPNDGFMLFFAGTNNRAQDRMSVCNWNCYGQSAGKFKMKDSPTGSGYTTYTTAPWSGGNFDADSVLDDPLFVDAAGDTPADFALQGGSPCIGAGKSNGTSGGSAVDIGAWGNSPPASFGCDF